MVNVRALANRATSGINPNIAAQLKSYAGKSTPVTGKQEPLYAAVVPIIVQAQALGKKEIEHLDSMNISGADRAVYANQQLAAVDRVTQSGGDLLRFENAVWLVVAVLEGWTTAGWGKVALQRQVDNPNAGWS